MKIKDHYYSKEDFEVKPSPYPGILETYPKRSEEELLPYYNTSEYISHQSDPDTLLGKAYLFVKHIMVKRKRCLIYKHFTSGSILDIGTGTGNFLKGFDAKKWDKYAIEPNHDLHKELQNAGISLIPNVEHIPKQKFEVISLWHSLEHIPDLESTIQILKNSIKPNGLLVIAVPNYKSYDALHYKNFWAAWDVPRHVWHFSKQGIVNIFQNKGFKYCYSKPLWADAFYIAILSEQYKGKPNFIKALSIGLYSNLFGVFKKEFSSFIYVFKA